MCSLTSRCGLPRLSGLRQRSNQKSNQCGATNFSDPRLRLRARTVVRYTAFIVKATGTDLSGLEELARRNGFGTFGRLVDVINEWAQSDQSGEIPASYARPAATELAEMLLQLPALVGYKSEIEFVLGYKPLQVGLLPDADAEDVRTWHGFQGRAFRNAEVTNRDEQAAIREQWIPLVHELATYVGKRHRIARARQSNRVASTA